MASNATVAPRGEAPPRSVELLNGGAEAFPRMLAAMGSAKQRIHLEAILHAKALVVDERRMLIGSFNLDPLSLVNLEVLVDVEDPAVAAKGDAWIADHCVRSREINAQAVAGPALRVWLLEPWDSWWWGLFEFWRDGWRLAAFPSNPSIQPRCANWPFSR